MSNRDRFLAIGVAVLWGLNFLAIHASLLQFPPFLLIALRFAVLAIPTIVFVPRPKVPVRYLLGYGVGFGILQFFFLYLAMSNGMPTGLASLVLQSAAPFTVVLGATVLAERLGREQIIGIVVAVLGLTLVGSQQVGTQALIPFLLTLCAGLGWAFGSICSRQARPAKPLHFTLWMTVVPPIPMAAVSLVLEGPSQIARSFTTLTTPTGVWALVGLAYTVVLGTIVGSGIWTQLLARNPASRIAPFSMLVPVVGMSSAWLVLGEALSGLELVGAAAVVGGVLWGSGAIRRRIRPAAALVAPTPAAKTPASDTTRSEPLDPPTPDSAPVPIRS